MANCPQCGAPIPAGVFECKYCGEKIQPQQQTQQTYQQPQANPYQQPQANPYQQPQANPYQQPYQQPIIERVYVQQPANDGVNPAWPIKSKVAAGILALFFGGIGIHKFYLGKVGMGILYLLFCWTGIPAIVGFIEGIIYLTSNDHNFQISNQVRLQ